MIGRKRKRLGDLLVDAGVVTSEQLGEALKKQRELGLKLGETLIELKFTDENEIVEALHQQMGYPVGKNCTGSNFTFAGDNCKKAQCGSV